MLDDRPRFVLSFANKSGSGYFPRVFREEAAGITTAKRGSIMDKPQEQNERVKLPRDPFAYIGFWQLMTFVIMILLVWVNELHDVSAMMFNTPWQEINVYRACFLTAGVLVAGIICIGNTYLQQKRVLNSLLSVCASCHKVRVSQQRWQQLEAYISENSLLTFTHGLCPDCMERMMQAINERRQGSS